MAFTNSSVAVLHASMVVCTSLLRMQLTLHPLPGDGIVQLRSPQKVAPYALASDSCRRGGTGGKW